MTEIKQILAKELKEALALKEQVEITINQTMRQLIEIGVSQLGSLSALADAIDVSHAYLSKARNNEGFKISKTARDKIVRLTTLNICPDCGIETESDVCPNTCKSKSDPKVPKPTIPIIQVPTRCWDCKNKIIHPIHKRKYLSQCSECAKKGDAR